MYQRTFWKDHIVDEDTKEVLQEGTLQDAEHFNNMEEGIFEANELASANSERLVKQKEALENLEGEVIETILTNTSAYPFNNSKKTISLSHSRSTQNYVVEPEILLYSDGGVGDIEITDKMLNGFKIAFTGAAKSVSVKLHISGGK